MAKKRSRGSQLHHEARKARRAAEREAYSADVDALHTKVQAIVQRDEEAMAPKQITGRKPGPRTRAKPRMWSEDPVQPMTDTVIGSGMVNLSAK